MFDATRFPNAAAYLSTLPQGMHSYPECQVRVDTHRHVVEDFPQLTTLQGLPEPLSTFLSGSYQPQWLPEVAGNVLYMLVRDIVGSDDEFLAWNRKNIDRLFDKPLNRVLIFIFSTSLIVMGASKRWATFHQGTSMEPRPIEKDAGFFKASACLSYPVGIFNALMLRQHCNTYMAALQACKAEDVSVEYMALDAGKAEYHARWKA